MKIYADTALLPQGWVKAVRLAVDDGRISDIETGVRAAAEDYYVQVLLPSVANLHSHAFQRAMAGTTEVRSQGPDSFWTWRKQMYAFLDLLTPDHIEAITAQVQMEMLEAGFTAVGEFHYLHHQPEGAVYDQISELSQRVCAAAETTGIGLALLPVLYTRGGVSGAPLGAGQLRFGNDPERFCKLVEEAAPHVGSVSRDASIGLAPHSLRAVAADDLDALVRAFPGKSVHMHIAEQVREVEEVRAATGATPVQWLLENAPVDERWCLVHATHMTAAETSALARTGAVAGLCPITEANLGDGIFNGPEWLNDGGRFGLGSDSNLRISLSEELRTLEYSQRLRDQQRNVMAPEGGSVGETLYVHAAQGGAQALGRDAGSIQKGRLADLVSIDRLHPALLALRDEQLLDGFAFVAGDGVVRDVWSAGRHVVQEGQHVARAGVSTRFAAAMSDLMAQL